MRPTRLLASLAMGALVAVPGFALAAQGGPPAETPPVETPPEDPPGVNELAEDEEQDEPEVDKEAEELAETQEGDGDEAGHGEVISALAQCLPSGRELHGTGLTKGFVMSQAASTGEVVLPGVATPFLLTDDPASVDPVCAAVIAMAEDPANDPSERAKGRPDWAGPKDDGAEEDAAVEGAEADDAEEDAEPGPPEHAGKGKKADKARGRG